MPEEHPSLPKSPVTEGPSKLIAVFPTHQIEKSYLAIDMDVSDYFRGISHLELRQCLDTGLRYFSPSFCIGDGEFYDKLQLRPLYYPDLRWEYPEVIRLVQKSDRLLEIGCGRGAFLKLFNQEVIPNSQPVGLELSQDAVNQAQSENLDVRCQLVSDHASEHPAAYDLVCAFQVLEHVAEVGNFLQACLSCLVPGGHLVFTVPYSYPYLYHQDKWEPLNLPPHHASLWDRKSIRGLAAAIGCELTVLAHEPLEDKARWAHVCLEYYSRSSFLGQAARSLVGRLPSKLTSWMKWLPGHTVMMILRKSQIS